MARRVLKKRRGRPRTGAALSAAERMRRMRARRKADGLKAVISWLPGEPAAQAPYSSHRLLDVRSLAMHAMIAEKIQQDPRLVDVARRNLDRWQSKWGDRTPIWVDQWRVILRRPLPEIAALLTEPGETATRLRQSTPFAGVLTAVERRRIYAAFRA